jgi:hypothetical protein
MKNSRRSQRKFSGIQTEGGGPVLVAVKDLAEHIRTVHFTLLVLCLALFAITWRQRPNAERALKDANSLNNLSSDPDNFRRILAKIDQESDDAARNSYRRTKCLPDVGVLWVDHQERTFRLKTSRCWIYQNEPSSLMPSGELGLPYTLGAFSLFWTHNHQPRMFIPGSLDLSTCEFATVDKTGKTVQLRAMPQLLTAPPGDSESKATEITVEPKWSSNGKLQFSNHSGLGSSMSLADNQPLNVDITVEAQPLRFNLQDVITGVMKRDWSGGTFEDSFPDLAEMTKPFTEVPLKDLPVKLNTFVASYRKSIEAGEEKIDVWGVKLSTATLKYARRSKNRP